jgi:hypothetical protein
VVNGSWKRLVFGHPVRDDASVNRHAYTFCVLEQFWRGLKRREIYADASTKWRNPQAELLEGHQWDAIRPEVLTALSLPADPDELLAEHARTLDAAYKEVGGRLIANPDVRVDASGKIHLTGVKAVDEPPSLVDLRNRTTAMLPRVELPEMILEVMSWVLEMAEAFTAISGGRSRLKDLPVSIAACLTVHSLNCLESRSWQDGRAGQSRKRIASRASRRARFFGRGAGVAIHTRRAANPCRTWPMGRCAGHREHGRRARHARTRDPG